MLLSDMSAPMAIPSGPGTSPVTTRGCVRGWTTTAERYAGGIAESVSELADLQLVQTAGVMIRSNSSAPLFKLYLINERDLFWSIE